MLVGRLRSSISNGFGINQGALWGYPPNCLEDGNPWADEQMSYMHCLYKIGHEQPKPPENECFSGSKFDFLIIEQFRLGLIQKIPVERSAIAPVCLNPKNHFPNLSRQSFSLWKIPSLRGSSKGLIVVSSSNTPEIHPHQSYSSLAPEHVFLPFLPIHVTLKHIFHHHPTTSVPQVSTLHPLWPRQWHLHVAEAAHPNLGSGRG